MKFSTSLYASSRLSETIQSIDVANGCIAALRMYDEDKLRKIQLILAELVANSVEHGNKLDPSKAVGILITVVEGGMELEVTDEGRGIDPAVLIRPYDAAGKRGHGLWMVRELTGNMRIKDGHICTLLSDDMWRRGNR